MKPDVFFKNFELLAEAPNGVQKLRELILQLAVMGKLVPQDPNDESAAVLLERIIAEKEKLMQERKIRKSDSSSTINQDEKFFELPIGWKWVSIGEVSILQGGKRLPKGANFSPIPTSHIYIQVTNMKNGTIEESGQKYIDEEVYNLIKKYIIEKDDLYITIAGTIGQVGEIPESFHRMNLTENAAKIVFRGLNKKYLLLAIRSNLVQIQFSEKTNQQAQPKLALKRIESTIIPLPPLAEQKRIVEKVDELMALCDKLEARRQKKQELQSKLNSAALDRMLSAENQDEFEQNWQRICENFDLLYDNPENVGKLKQAILQLAVQGKLVEQNQGDEQASVLIEKIKVTKEKLVKEGKSQKTKSFPEICIDELPYGIPESWKWTRLDDIIINLKYGTSKKCAYDISGVPVLRIPNVVNGKIDTNDLKFTTLSQKEKFDLRLESGDLLLIRSNGSTSLVGRSAVIDGELDGYAYAGYLVRLRTFSTDLFSDYLHLTLNSRYVRDQIEMPIRTTSGVKNINSTEISRLIIPLPPLNEQKRIVEKVEQLMGLCDELELKLRKEKEDSEKLMETVVRGLLEGAATEI